MRISIWHSSFVLAMLLLFCFVTNASALEKATHLAINGHVVGLSGLNQHVKNIGLSGTNQLIGTRTIKQLIELGGETEDEPYYTRSFNHYLNPINNTGYNGLFKSALEWSHSQGTIGSQFGGDYSWPAVRSYYLNALTSTDKAARDNSFAMTFQGVGQLMHLVTDMSVPAHTRNDGHVLYNYENWVNNHKDLIKLSTPVYFSGALSNYDPLFLDLAAFSNANFLSDDTIFTGFTYPRIEDTELWYDRAYNRNYLRKPAVTNAGVSTGVGVEHLAASSWLYFYRLRYFPQDRRYIPVGLDDNVYADYAALLLPRAVGYSANMLFYFFRGQITMAPDTNNPGNYVIKNESPESMNGTFSLYYDDTSGNRKSAGVDLSAANNITLASGAASSSIASFIEPSDIMEKGKYMLVFEGRLGSEQRAVVGKAVALEGGGLWEDFEGPGGFRQNWLPPQYSANEYQYEVVKGYGSNTSNVLKITGVTTRGWDYLYVPVSASMPMPKTISFDYLARNINLTKWGFGYLTLRVSGRFPGGQVYAVDVNSVNSSSYYSLGCGQYSFTNGAFYEFCNEEVAPGDWIHVKDMPLSRTGVLKEVYFFIVGDSEGASYEIYIDNIDLKQE